MDNTSEKNLDDVLTDISDVNEEEYNLTVEPGRKQLKQTARRKIEEMLEEQYLKRAIMDFDEV